MANTHSQEQLLDPGELPYDVLQVTPDNYDATVNAIATDALHSMGAWIQASIRRTSKPGLASTIAVATSQYKLDSYMEYLALLDAYKDEITAQTE